ncbi:hypothetical protein DL93DRAFT_2085697 [Clavulina sp. PMI_390]|nr:hypothetical protein DL93DRAFT_2085697 [Clavulina sp. PMI_390]
MLLSFIPTRRATDLQTTTSIGRKFSLNARKSMVEDPSASTSGSRYRTAAAQRSSSGQYQQQQQQQGQQQYSPQQQPRVSFSDSRRSSPPSPGPARSHGSSSRNTHTLYTIPSEPSGSQQSLGHIPEASESKSHLKPMPAPSNSYSTPTKASASVPELRTQSLQGAAERITASSSSSSTTELSAMRIPEVKKNGSSSFLSELGPGSPVGYSYPRSSTPSPPSPSIPINVTSPPASPQKLKKANGTPSNGHSFFGKRVASSSSGPPQVQLNGLGTGNYPSGGRSASPAGKNRTASSPAVGGGGVRGRVDSSNLNGLRSGVRNGVNGRSDSPHGSMTDLIGAPVLDRTTTAKMNPALQNGNRPIMVDTRRLSTGTHHTLPRELVDDIERFMTSEFAQSYFSTHRRGLIFRRRVPLEEMMQWQKNPLTGPLLVLKRQWHKDALKIFRVVQTVMGDRELVRGHVDGTTSIPSSTSSHSSSTSSALGTSSSSGGHGEMNGRVNGSVTILEAERWVLGMGVSQGELRDEIYCQVMKQLTKNPDADSIFRGWQLFCVILVTFPPSKNLEGYVGTFIQERITTKRDDPGRIDVMAKYCLQRLGAIAKKGPRGKPPTLAEIETASDAAFNPSTFGASLDFIFKLQQRSYPDAKVPIILPFLGDGIIALGGLATEGIWRISGDSETVSELKVRIDRGYYNLEGIDDCHVPASLLKLWLRELEEPLIPEAMYNECLAVSAEPDKVIDVVRRLPTINRRVLLFVISLMQLFLHDNIIAVTKMTSPAMALVISPALLRCTSDHFSTVFTNAQHEHTFVHNLLVHLQPHRIDPDYIPMHGQGSNPRGR